MWFLPAPCSPSSNLHHWVCFQTQSQTRPCPLLPLWGLILDVYLSQDPGHLVFHDVGLQRLRWQETTWPVLSSGPPDGHFPLCPPSTRISGFLVVLCWAPPPCPWFWPVPQIMLSQQVAGVDSISSQNLTRHHLSFLFHSHLSPYTSWCPGIRKCYFFFPWDLPLPRQHHLLSSPLDWKSIQWSQRVSPSSSSWCSDRKHLLKLTPAYSPLILASLQFWSLRQPTGFMVDYESWSKAIF